MPINEAMESSGGAFDVPSEKDYQAIHLFGALQLDLPDRVNLNVSPSHNQGKSMHCTGYAATHYEEIMNTLEFHMQALADPEEQFSNQKYQAGPVRAAEMDKEGDSLQNAMTALSIHGLNNKNPSIPVDKYQITNYARIEKTIDVIKSWLAKGFPIYTGSGNHCYLIVGYEEANKVLIWKNSYGPKWGPRGDGTSTINYSDIDMLFSCYIFYDKQDMNMIYKDVSDKSPMAKNIKRMLDLGIMRGYGTSNNAIERSFLPDKPVTRAEVAELMGNLIDKFNLTPKNN